MWIPKTEEELKSEERKREKNARHSALFFFVFLPMAAILKYKFLGSYNGKLLESTLTWPQIFEMLPNIFLISCLGGILAYIGFRKFNEVTTQVCLKCGKLKQFKKNENCECGGKLKMLNEMKWSENNDQNQNSSRQST